MDPLSAVSAALGFAAQGIATANTVNKAITLYRGADQELSGIGDLVESTRGVLEEVHTILEDEQDESYPPHLRKHPKWYERVENRTNHCSSILGAIEIELRSLVKDDSIRASTKLKWSIYKRDVVNDAIKRLQDVCSDLSQSIYIAAITRETKERQYREKIDKAARTHQDEIDGIEAAMSDDHIRTLQNNLKLAELKKRQNQAVQRARQPLPTKTTRAIAQEISKVKSQRQGAQVPGIILSHSSKPENNSNFSTERLDEKVSVPPPRKLSARTEHTILPHHSESLDAGRGNVVGQVPPMNSNPTLDANPQQQPGALPTASINLSKSRDQHHVPIGDSGRQEASAISAQHQLSSIRSSEPDGKTHAPSLSRSKGLFRRATVNSAKSSSKISRTFDLLGNSRRKGGERGLRMEDLKNDNVPLAGRMRSESVSVQEWLENVKENPQSGQPKEIDKVSKSGASSVKSSDAPKAIYRKRSESVRSQRQNMPYQRTPKDVDTGQGPKEFNKTLRTVLPKPLRLKASEPTSKGKLRRDDQQPQPFTNMQLDIVDLNIPQVSPGSQKPQNLLPYLEGWMFRPAQPIQGSPGLTWSRIVRAPLPISFEDMSLIVRQYQQSKKQFWDDLLGLSWYQRQQLARLVDFRNRNDGDRCWEWSIAAIQTEPADASKFQITTIHIILQRHPRIGAEARLNTSHTTMLDTNPAVQDERGKIEKTPKVSPEQGFEGNLASNIATVPRENVQPKIAGPRLLIIGREHLDPETLDDFNLPWEYYKYDPNYFHIKQYVPDHTQQELFAHTQARRQLIKRRNEEIDRYNHSYLQEPPMQISQQPLHEMDHLLIEPRVQEIVEPQVQKDHLALIRSKQDSSRPKGSRHPEQIAPEFRNGEIPFRMNWLDRMMLPYASLNAVVKAGNKRGIVSRREPRATARMSVVSDITRSAIPGHEQNAFRAIMARPMPSDQAPSTNVSQNAPGMEEINSERQAPFVGYLNKYELKDARQDRGFNRHTPRDPRPRLESMPMREKIRPRPSAPPGKDILDRLMEEWGDPEEIDDVEWDEVMQRQERAKDSEEEEEQPEERHQGELEDLDKVKDAGPHATESREKHEEEEKHTEQHKEEPTEEKGEGHEELNP